MPLIPAAEAVVFEIKSGQQIKVINTHGNRPISFWAISPNEPLEFLSMAHSRTILRKVVLAEGDKLYSNRAESILTLVEDTAGGIHDMMCATEASKNHQDFALHDKLSELFKTLVPHSVGTKGWVPDPLNLFLNVTIDHRGTLNIHPSSCEKGQYVQFLAEKDLVIVARSYGQEYSDSGHNLDCEYQIMNGAEILPPPKNLSIGVSSPSRRVKIALSVDFDAVSHWLGTGCHKDNNMADYSSGTFAGQVGVYRLLDLFRKHGIADKMTWFIPGHTAETFPEATESVYKSGAEIALHGYAHEGIYQMTEEQEREVLLKCIEVATRITGKKPRGYRAPMYTIRETTIKLLREHGFLYNSSLMHHDSQPYFTPNDPPIKPIDWSQPASSWLHPSVIASQAYPEDQHPLVELPCGWYNEDMMPMMYLPHLSNSMGYVSTDVVEQMWKNKFLWLWENGGKEGNEFADFIFPLLVHPDVTGLAHIIPMIDRFLGWLQSFGESVEFCKCEDIAAGWLDYQQKTFHKGKENA